MLFSKALYVTCWFFGLESPSTMNFVAFVAQHEYLLSWFIAFCSAAFGLRVMYLTYCSRLSGHSGSAIVTVHSSPLVGAFEDGAGSLERHLPPIPGTGLISAAPPVEAKVLAKRGCWLMVKATIFFVVCTVALLAWYDWDMEYKAELQRRLDIHARSHKESEYCQTRNTAECIETRESVKWNAHLIHRDSFHHAWNHTLHHVDEFFRFVLPFGSWLDVKSGLYLVVSLTETIRSSIWFFSAAALLLSAAFLLIVFRGILFPAGKLAADCGQTITHVATQSAAKENIRKTVKRMNQPDEDSTNNHHEDLISRLPAPAPLRTISTSGGFHSVPHQQLYEAPPISEPLPSASDLQFFEPLREKAL